MVRDWEDRNTRVRAEYARAKRVAFADYVAKLTAELIRIEEDATQKTRGREFYPKVLTVRVDGEDPKLHVAVDLLRADGEEVTKRYSLWGRLEFRREDGNLLDGATIASRIAMLARGMAY